MAALSTLSLNYADWAKRINDGKIQAIIELLSQSNEVLDDMRWMEGNTTVGHRTTVRSGLPTPTWRQLNYGVQPGKSTTVQITDTTGMLEQYSEIDKALADLNGNTAEFRLSEDYAFLEAMTQAMATAVFYGNSAVNPERIMGLAPRYNSLSAGNASNIIDAGGVGSDNTSLWLVVWGDLSCHGIFPKGSKAGLQMNNLGEQTLFDNATPPGRYQGYRTHYKWDAGLTLRDWRYAVRIANIDTTTAAGGLQGSTPPDLIKYMIRAYHKIPSFGVGKAAFYGNRTLATWLDIQRLNRTNLEISLDEFAGKKVNSFRGIPIRTVDALTNAETRVT